MDLYDVSDRRFRINGWNLDTNKLGDETSEIDIGLMIAKPLFVE